MGGCDEHPQRHRLQAHRRQRRVATRRATCGCTSWSRSRPDTCEPEWVGAEHPLFILYTSGSTGKPKGVQHFHRRLPAVGDADDEVDVRHQAGRRLLVHRRHRLGHRPHLHRLRPAGRRRHRGHLRRRADLSGRRPLLEDDRRSTRSRLLHGADRDPLAHQGGGRRRRDCIRRTTTCPACASSARSASRSIRKPGCGTTRTSAASAARSSTPGGRPRPAAT